MADIEVTQTGVLIMVAALPPIEVTQTGVIIMTKDATVDSGVSAGMIAHLNAGTTYLCTLWKVTAVDGTIVRGCNHTRNITYNSELYKAIPLDPSQLSKSVGLGSSNADLISPYIIGGLEKKDIVAKKWNNARIEITIVNYLNLGLGPARRDVGYIGEITIEKRRYLASYDGISSRFAQEIGEIETPDCRAILGDSRCQKDLTAFTHNCAVDGLSTTYPRRIIQVDLDPAKADEYFKRGKITVTSGNNNGIVRDIKTSRGNIIELVIPFDKDIEIGDTVTVVAGCDGRRQTCKTVFNNVINIQASPDLPGIESVYTFPED